MAGEHPKGVRGRSPRHAVLAPHHQSGHYPVMSRLLTPAQVAKLASCGRSSVMRALISGTLRGIRDNKNRWKVEEDEAARWAGQRPDSDRTDAGHHPDADRSHPAETSEAMARLAIAETEARMLREQLDEVRADRDRLGKLLEKALEPRPRTLGWFDRLLGRM